MIGGAHEHDGTRADCVGCAAIARRIAGVRAAMTIDDRLDDVTRARIWERLDARIAVRARMPWARWAAAFAAAAVAAALLGIATRGGGDERVELASAPAMIAPADAVLTAPLGPHTRAALVGPARLSVVGAAGDATTVRLERGTLYASFDGGAGRSLRVIAPGAIVDVVGTLFAVEAGGAGGETCVSVEHGRVRVTMGARVVMVGGGEKVCTGTADVTATIDDAVRVALVRHEEDGDPRPSPRPGPRPSPSPGPSPSPSPSPGPSPSPSPSPSPLRRPAPVTGSATETATATATSTAAETTAPETKPPAGPSADDLYRTAEDALARDDRAAADRALAELVAGAPRSPLVDQALYERARIAYARRAWAESRRQLDALFDRAPGSPLVEPGRYLACRIAVEAGDADATACLTAFRAAYPKSAHDKDVLGLLAQLAHASGGCDAARSYVDELAAAHADAALARAWRARCPEAP